MSTLGIIFLIWFVAQILSDEKKKKQKRQRQPLPQDIPGEPSRRERHPIDFEIPPIAGAPGQTAPMPQYPYEEPQVVFQEEIWPIPEPEPQVSREVREDLPEPVPTAAEESSRTGQKLPLLRNPETAREAVLYAEIFGRPKALRRRYR